MWGGLWPCKESGQGASLAFLPTLDSCQKFLVSLGFFRHITPVFASLVTNGCSPVCLFVSKFSFSYKNTCYWIKNHLNLVCMCVCSVAQSCLTLCDPHGLYNPPGFSVHEILQARILEWVVISFSRGSSWPRNQICFSHDDLLLTWLLRPYFQMRTHSQVLGVKNGIYVSLGGYDSTHDKCTLY